MQFTASQRPISRLLQKGHDTILQRSLNKANRPSNRETSIKKYADRRVSHARGEGWRRAEQMQILPQMIHEAGKNFGPALSKKEGNLAIAVRSMGILPHELRDRLNQVRQDNPEVYGGNADLANQAHVLHQKNVLVKNKLGRVVINKKLYPQLARADRLAKRGQVERNKILLDYGLMTPEGLASREAIGAEVTRSEAARNECGCSSG